MKPGRHDWSDMGGALSQPRECSDETLAQPEIVGEIENPVLEMVRRLWWRAFDRVSGCLVSFRLWLFDRIHGPEPPTPADCNARPITSGWSKPLQWPVKQSNQQNSMPGQIKAALPAPRWFFRNSVHHRLLQPPTPGTGISALRCRRRIPREKIGAGNPRSRISNQNHRRDEIGIRRPARRARRFEPTERMHP